MRTILLAASALAVLPLGAAAAQQPGQAAAPETGQAQRQPADPAREGRLPQAGGGQRQVAQPCLDDLAALVERMDKEGYWLSGWRYGGTFGSGAPPATGAGASSGAPEFPDPGAAGAAGQEAAPSPAATGPASAGSPWGTMEWADTPRHELGTLHDAARILARRGNEQGCQDVLAELGRAYDGYTAELRRAGVEPGVVVGWRTQQLLAARPVGELGPRLRLDSLVGTDVRNLRDEHLGSVADLVLDPRSGDIAYAVVGRGGLLGVGARQVPVPWQALQATPGLNAFVLNVDAKVLDGAPGLEAAPGGGAAPGQQRPEEIERYWDQHLAG